MNSREFEFENNYIKYKYKINCYNGEYIVIKKIICFTGYEIEEKYYYDKCPKALEIDHSSFHIITNTIDNKWLKVIVDEFNEKEHITYDMNNEEYEEFNKKSKNYNNYKDMKEYIQSYQLEENFKQSKTSGIDISHITDPFILFTFLKDEIENLKQKK